MAGTAPRRKRRLPRRFAHARRRFRTFDTARRPATARGPLLALTVGAIGVVFGDIGTSPLYAMREALAHAQGGGGGELAVLGVVSLVFWALILVVTVKYVIFLMRADNKGEGGTLALMALAQRSCRAALDPDLLPRRLCGAALFYGDGIITPAVSVLSAVEGLQDAPGVGRQLDPLRRCRSRRAS